MLRAAEDKRKTVEYGMLILTWKGTMNLVLLLY